MSTKVYIKNMVCPRCIATVKKDMENLGYHIIDIKLGEVEVEENVDYHKLKSVLQHSGFDIIEDKNTQLVNAIKTEIINIVHHSDILPTQKLSTILTDKLSYEYNTLSHVFSAQEGLTIERFYILQRIEKVKEYLEYNQLSLKEIAFKLGFSSIAHLSAQFKKETGLSPKQYKELGLSDRKPIHQVY
ncbi:helix-turn-helix domain-containing protein [Pseudopedobacter beijingensis]|uniref:Helix-turn-helix domain-containing protein n=1 Tax=Pseudopedobacter beijingensis TaxID=1207056 RepID=A0ABW4I9Q0_9SPHI